MLLIITEDRASQRATDYAGYLETKMLSELDCAVTVTTPTLLVGELKIIGVKAIIEYLESL